MLGYTMVLSGAVRMESGVRKCDEARVFDLVDLADRTSAYDVGTNCILLDLLDSGMD
jgi:hypothetical protein